MKAIIWFAAATLLQACGDDAATKKIEATVTAAITQKLGNGHDTYVQQVHTWYQSDVPNLIKLSPKTEAIYKSHADILQEVATHEPRLVQLKGVTPAQAGAVHIGYQKLVGESASRVEELSALAQNGTSMSEAEQLQYVSDLADKQTHHLALVRYYTQRMEKAIARMAQQENDRKYRQQMFGLE